MKVVQKSEGRQELHRGLLWVQTIIQFRVVSSTEAVPTTRDSFRHLLSLVWIILLSLCGERQTRLLWLQRWTSEGQDGGARREVSHALMTNDRKRLQPPTRSTVHLFHL